MISKLPLLSLLCLVLCLPQSHLTISSHCYNIKSAVDKINRFILFQLNNEKLPIKPQKIGIFSSKFVPNQPCKLKLLIYSKSFHISYYYFKEALDEFNRVQRIEQIFQLCSESAMILSRYERSLVRMLFRSSQTLNSKQCRKLQQQNLTKVKAIAVPAKRTNESVETKLILKQPHFIFYTTFFLVLIAIGFVILCSQLIIFGHNVKSISSIYSHRADEDANSNNEYLMPHFHRNPIFIEIIHQLEDTNEISQLSAAYPNHTSYVQDWINDYYLTRNTLKETNSKERMLIQDRIFHARKIDL